jgi:hypothetical protein
VKEKEATNKLDTAPYAVIHLKVPIEIGGSKIGSFKMRRPRVRDRLALDNVIGDMAKDVHIIASLCGYAPEEIHDLDYADFMACQRQLNAFVGAPSAT